MNSTAAEASSSVDLKSAYLVISIVNLGFVVFGTFGNLFTFMILMRKNLRTVYSYTRYLSALCLIDIICLYNWNFSFIYQDLSASRMRIEHFSPLSCRLFSFIAYSSLQLSSWIMCAIGIDRIILLASTSRKKTVNSSTGDNSKKSSVSSMIAANALRVNPFQSTVAVFVLLIVVIVSTNTVVLINNATPYSDSSNSTSLNASTNARKRTFTCYSPEDFFKKWDIFHVLMYSLIPFGIIFTQNFIISVLTVRHSKRMKNYKNKSVSVAVSGAVSTTLHPEPSRISRMIKSIKNVGSSASTTNGNAASASKAITKRLSVQSKGTYVKNLLIFLTLSFFFTTLPYSMIYATSLNDILITTKAGNILKRCLISLQYTRHASNFLIYILTSTIIQSEIKKCFKEIEFFLFKRTI